MSFHRTSDAIALNYFSHFVGTCNNEKKVIKIFFKAVSDGDIYTVSELLNNNPEYLTVCNVAPPKKDDGQSGLQVAFKTGNFEILNS
ncbi:MAG: hypothetical protein ACO3FI_08900 [Cyclobacteriaceae bacterium]